MSNRSYTKWVVLFGHRTDASALSSQRKPGNKRGRSSNTNTNNNNASGHSIIETRIVRSSHPDESRIKHSDDSKKWQLEAMVGPFAVGTTERAKAISAQTGGFWAQLSKMYEFADRDPQVVVLVNKSQTAIIGSDLLKHSKQLALRV